jgi:hypothetical protein
MTYPEIADALGIAIPSTRNVVRKKGWQRKVCENGFGSALVPIEDLEQHQRRLNRFRDVTGASPAPSTTDRKRIVAAVEEHVTSLRAEVSLLSGLIAAQRAESEDERRKAAELAAELGTLRYILAEVTAERDVERSRGRQVDVLNAILELERKQVAELREDRDHWREAASRRLSQTAS